MRNLEKNLKNKTIEYEKLIEYGFQKEGENYFLKTPIYHGQFEMMVTITEKSKTSKLIDLESNEEYILVDIEDSAGKFVGEVREEYEHKLQDIFKKCTIHSVFNNQQTKQIIQYIREKYQDELEFLWEKFDSNAIWRNKETKKWYGLLGKIPKNKLGISSEEVVEILNLHYRKEKIDTILAKPNIYPGYHMNKKSWITIILDDSVETETIYQLIDYSYQLSLSKKNISN